MRQAVILNVQCLTGFTHTVMFEGGTILDFMRSVRGDGFLILNNGVAVVPYHAIGQVSLTPPAEIDRLQQEALKQATESGAA